MKNLPDVQQSTDGFPNISINKVGVRNIKVPFELKLSNGEKFETIATISSYCNLVESLKGINMSRIGRSIYNVMSRDNDGFTNLNDFVEELHEAHGTDDIYIKARFDYIFKDEIPITKLDTHEPVNVIFESVLRDGELRNFVTVETTEMSLCPCSKEMSLLKNNITEQEREEIEQLPEKLQDKLMKAGFGAHNQKSMIETTVEVDTDGFNGFSLDWLIGQLRSAASSPTYSILKRPDEKWVTEVSYMSGYYDGDYEFVEVNNGNHGPKFVEDISRQLAEKLNESLDDKIKDYVIVVNNHESIHSEDIVATAVLNAGRELQ